VRLLANPLVLRAGVVLFCATFAFLMGLIFIRLLRKSINDEAEISSDAKPSLEALPLHVYNTVIQQLKQQKHELIAQSQAEQNRARTSETFSQAVLSNLSCGVLVFGTNGLVKTSNPAAKEILGFASTTGMGAEDIFRGAVISNTECAASAVSTDHEAINDQETGEASFEDAVLLSDEVDAVLHEGSGRREAQAEYETPAGETRFIAVTVSPVKAVDGSLLGVACLINDVTELERIRSERSLQGEISAEMALQLRTSLNAISGYAQQLAEAGDATQSRQLATDIAHEAASLGRNIGSFLAAKGATQGAAVGARN
jgi:PAS domain-containing protein